MRGLTGVLGDGVLDVGKVEDTAWILRNRDTQVHIEDAGEGGTRPGGLDATC